MRSLSLRMFVAVSLFLVPLSAFAANVTINGTTTFAALDGGADDADHAHNGVFTVNGNLTVNGSINCNDMGGGSACPMTFNVSGDVLLNPGSSLYAENRVGNGNGGNITLTVGGNLLLKGTSGLTAGALVSSYATGSSHSNAGNITANVGGTMTTEKGSIVDAGSRNALAGKINLVSGGPASFDGQLLSGPGRTFLGGELEGGTPNAKGGEIHVQSTTFVEPGMTVGSNALIIAQSSGSSSGPVTIDGCGIVIKGIILGLGDGSGATRVAIRSGKSILIDSRDFGVIGATLGRNGHVGSDALGGTAANNSVGLYAGTSITILGPAPGANLFYSISALSLQGNGSAGTVRVISLGDTVTVSGNAIYASDVATGARGGTVEISGKGNLNLDTMVVAATGDFSSSSSSRHGGAINVRSYSGNAVWTNGTGDARPTGSSVPATVRGTITITACGTVSTSGSTFPTNGAPVGAYPATTSGNCSSAAPSLPASEPALQTCNTPPTANSQSVTTLEDHAITITMTASDPDNQTLTFSIVTPPAHGTLGPIMNATATSAQVVYTPNANYNGSDSFTFMANDGNGGTATGIVSITITPVNDAPSFNTGASPQTSLEDAGPQFVSPWASGISAGPADESTQHVTFQITGNTNPSLFSAGPSVSPSGALSYTAAPNANGSASITVVAHDDGGTANGGVDTSAPQNFTINIVAVNDAPSFTKGADQTTLEDSGAQSVSGWATAISAGPADESGQSVSFNVTGNSNPSLFSAGPAVAPDGTLTYTPAPNANGTATISVAAHDNGGTANGGVDTSASQSFTITVTAVNDAPGFTKGADQTSLEDGGPQTVAGWATAISAGPADESSQTVTFTTANNAPALFSVQPAVASNGTLTYTAAPNAYGTATVTVTAHDDGGTANGGADTSAPQTFTITISPVNDAPSFTRGGDVTVLEDSAAYSQAGWATGISAGPNEGSQTVTFIVSSNNPALFSVQPSVSSNGTLSFALAPNANGAATVSVAAHDDGGTANGGVDTSASQTFSITVIPVNDAPSFTKGADVTANEDSGPYTQASWATAISAGPADEAGQSVAFNVTNNNNALFAVQPSVAPNGTLTFTPASNAVGSATVTLSLTDNGGTANGGVDTSASQTFVITVNGVNDPPSFTKGPDQTSFEDGGPQVVSGWATAISPGPADESSQTVTFTTANDNNPLFSVQPSVASDGTLTYTAAANAYGTATVTVTAHDDGGTANGGSDTSAPQTFTITIAPVNDAPSFTGGGNVSVLEDTGAYSQSGWATAISDGPNESGQALTFHVANDNNALFSVQPAIAADGTLTFSLAANAFGSTTVTVTLQDDGGTANGGADTSAPQTFTINVTGVNDAPSFTKGADQSSFEDAGPQTVAGWATAISAGPGEGTQTVNFNVSNDNPALFSVQPAVSANGTLTYTAAANANGTATVTVSIHDDGGTANGGVDTSAPQTFTITVGAVNDPPSFTRGADQTSLEDAGPQTVAGWATAISAGPADESSQTVSFTTTNDNNGLFSVQPSVAPDGTLTYTAAPNAFGTATVTVTAHDDGGTANGGVDSSAPQTFTITVSPVNDAPSFTKGPDVAANSNAGPQTYANWATAISAGPNEGTQTVNFLVSNNNNAAFTAQPAVSSTGTLTFTPAAAAPTTSVQVTVSAHDNGGTANGGVDTSAPQTFNVNITHSNSAPTANPDSFDAVGNTELAVGTTGAQAATLVATGSVLANDSDPENDPLTASVGAVTPGASVTMNADGSFRYLPPAGFAGNDTFTYNVSDGQATSTGTVTIHVTKRVLYVNNSAGAGGSGRVDSPYNALASAGAALQADDTIYLFAGNGTTSGQNAGVTLGFDGNRLIGEGVALKASGTYNGTLNPSLRAAGSRPQISNPAGVAVTVRKTPAATLTAAEVSGVDVVSAGSDGVLITDVTGMTMSSDHIAATTHNGVRGTRVAGFSFTNGIITGSGSTPGDSNIAFHDATAGTERNLTGTVTITGNTLTNAFYHGIDILNFDGTIADATITGNTLTSAATAPASNGSAIRLIAFGSATTASAVTKATITNNVIANFPSGTGIQLQGGNSTAGGPAVVYGVAGNATNVVTVTGNAIAGQSALVRMGTNNILASVSGIGQGNFNISNNGTALAPIGNVIGNAIAVSATGLVTVTATVSNNVIAAHNSLASSGISVAADRVFAVTDNASLTATVSGNTITFTDSSGILATARNSAASLGVRIQNNIVAAPLSGVRQGIRVDSGTATGNTTVCLDMSGNTSAGSGGATGIGLRKQGTAPAVNAFGVSGMAATATPGVEAYVNGNNPTGGGTTLLSASSGFSNCSLP